MRQPKPIPGDLIWVPAGTHLISWNKKEFVSSRNPSIGIAIADMSERTWKNWVKILYLGQVYLVNKDKIEKIDERWESMNDGRLS